MRILGSQARLVVLRARLRMRGRNTGDAWVEGAESVALRAGVRAGELEISDACVGFAGL
jgi:hypothetical protein